ncbi:hypothetical protein L1987_22163 [Smallanthus sonchifolius]|uniref:Uncharacterized protein n=1 Tax=Smallanthus sonchifolius TaxID=185202 RepID=A0ACB9IE40_9ASTR|nr:hypothetical protein L1987_22163 [Smallanthus sonchifolius]
MSTSVSVLPTVLSTGANFAAEVPPSYPPLTYTTLRRDPSLSHSNGRFSWGVCIAHKVFDEMPKVKC